MTREQEATSLPRIEKRAIEAMAIAPFIEAVSQKIGSEVARKLLREINEQEAFQRGQAMMVAAGKNGIAELAEDVASWGDGAFWEMDIIEKTATTYFFDVRRCPYYEKYKELGLEKYGVELSCCRDEPFARGLNPNLKLVRTKTIMEGADCCDFRYYLQAD